MAPKYSITSQLARWLMETPTGEYTVSVTKVLDQAEMLADYFL